jgi:hypothetical protein
VAIFIASEQTAADNLDSSFVSMKKEEEIALKNYNYKSLLLVQQINIHL